MAYGAWRHTAEQVAALYNVNRSKDAELTPADDVNPYSPFRAVKEPPRQEAMRVSPREFVAAIAANCGVPIQGI